VRLQCTVKEREKEIQSSTEPAVVDNHETSKSSMPDLRVHDGRSSFTITTPLFYANGPPHIGSAYPTIACDVMARYAGLQNGQVHFVTGMDEHGEKIARTARDKGKQPQEFVDDFAAEFQELWEKLAVQPDHFARTTSPIHKQLVQQMWQRCADKGDIYKRDYEGWYCVGCEAYLDDDEMLEGQICPIHQKQCNFRKENNYFFRLSKYWDRVRDHVKNTPNFILPAKRQNEVIYWLRDDNKRDFSISRASTSWGLPVPGDDSQVIYVWFDALIGYMSSLLQPGDSPTLEAAMSRGWPADVHIIGKDIMRFHAIYWPAMLMSADLPLPKHICTHGFITRGGLKMGKSLGNVVEPVPLVNDFGADAVRFFFSAVLNFGEDVDFRYEIFVKQVNNFLANNLGNLVHRCLTLSRKNLPEATSAKDLFDEGEDPTEHPVYQAACKAPAVVAEQFEQLEFTKAARAALGLAEAATLRLSTVTPWNYLKADSSADDRRAALREILMAAEAARICSVMLFPFTPSLSSRILAELSGEGLETIAPTWADTSWHWEPLRGLAKGPKPKPLFPRIDVEPWKGK
jgi:methionyl-tRNA synthetase